MTRAILTDIEGTTSSLSFVKDVLFPYARERIGAYVRKHAADPAVRAQVEEVIRAVGTPLSEEQVIAQLVAWIDEDRKITPLKALQGMIWEEGYRAGELKGHMYPDAVEKLRAWKAAGLKLYVYSSGSVLAQKLLFAHTEFGDLTPLFSGYFDTRVGGKREMASYQIIAKDIAIAPGEVLFLSDIREELDAAKAAGMDTFWLVRDRTGVKTGDTEKGHRLAQDFNAIPV